MPSVIPAILQVAGASVAKKFRQGDSPTLVRDETRSKPPTKLQEWSDILNVKYGFFPDSPDKMPLLRLPFGYYEPWERLVDDLNALILTGRIRKRIEKLPLLDLVLLLSDNPDAKDACDEPEISKDSASEDDADKTQLTLNGTRCLKRAHLVLSLLAHAYLVGFPGQNELEGVHPHILPKCIAVPWYQVSQILGLKPVMGYAAIDLANFKLLDEDEAPSLENLSMLHTFTGCMDEAWFYMVPLAIEIIGGGCVSIMLDLQEMIYTADIDAKTNLGSDFSAFIGESQFLDSLTTIKEKLLEMASTLKAMYIKNDPHIFWHRTRPYFTGSKNNKSLPHGLYYEGVARIKEDPYCVNMCDQPPPFLPAGTEEGSWRAYAGASAGQSPLIHALDVGLAIRHEPMKSQHGVKASCASGEMSSPPTQSKLSSNPMLEMREYLNGRERDFLHAFALGPCIRSFCLKHPILATAYNACIDAFKAFRDNHMQLVSVYISAQSRMRGCEGSPPSPGDRGHGSCERGTGGTALIPFLKQVRQETIDSQISMT